MGSCASTANDGPHGRTARVRSTTSTAAFDDAATGDQAYARAAAIGRTQGAEGNPPPEKPPASDDEEALQDQSIRTASSQDAAVLTTAQRAALLNRWAPVDRWRAMSRFQHRNTFSVRVENVAAFIAAVVAHTPHHHHHHGKHHRLHHRHHHDHHGHHQEQSVFPTANAGHEPPVFVSSPSKLRELSKLHAAQGQGHHGDQQQLIVADNHRVEESYQIIGPPHESTNNEGVVNGVHRGHHEGVDHHDDGPVEDDGWCAALPHDAVPGPLVAVVLNEWLPFRQVAVSDAQLIAFSDELQFSLDELGQTGRVGTATIAQSGSDASQCSEPKSPAIGQSPASLALKSPPSLVAPKSPASLALKSPTTQDRPKSPAMHGPFGWLYTVTHSPFLRRLTVDLRNLFSALDEEDTVAALIAQIRNLEAVELKGSRFGVKYFLDHLWQCKKLKHVTIEATSDATREHWDLSALGRCAHLEWVCIAKCSALTADTIASLASCKHLTKLELRDCLTVPEDIFARLPSLSQLSHLIVDSMKVPDTAFDHLQRCPNLKTVVLEYERVTKAVLTALGQCQHLETIRFVQCPIAAEDIGLLKTCAALVSLAIVECVATSASTLDTLCSITQLRELDLSGSETIIDQRRLGDQLKLMTSLRVLDLSNAGATDHAVELLHRCADLRRVVLVGAAITDAGLASLGALEKLEAVDLSRCVGITAGGIDALADCPLLQELTIVGAGKVLAPELAPVVRKLTALQELSLDRRQASDEVLAALEAAPSFHSLHVSRF